MRESDGAEVISKCTISYRPEKSKAGPWAPAGGGGLCDFPQHAREGPLQQVDIQVRPGWHEAEPWGHLRGRYSEFSKFHCLNWEMECVKVHAGEGRDSKEN